MTDSRTALPVPDDAQELAAELTRDLVGVNGLLREIETCWRHVPGATCGLPTDRLLCLQDTARRAEFDLRSLAQAAPGQKAGLALSAAGWFSLLKADIVSAWAVTRAAGIPTGSDAALWGSVADALHRAGIRMLHLVLALAPVTNWSVNGTPPAGTQKLWLLIELS